MKLFRLRITIRRLMIAVAMIGVFCAIVAHLERQHRFRMLTDYHGSKMSPHIGFGHRISSDPEDVLVLIDNLTDKPISLARARWHERLHDKYRQAARNPWFPVAMDPPEPK